MRKVFITFFKDLDIRSRQVRILSNYYKKRGFNKEEAIAKADSEVTKIQNSQVITVHDEIDSKSIADIVSDIARVRAFSFKIENIN